MPDAAWGDDAPSLTKRATALPRTVADSSRSAPERVGAAVATVAIPSVVLAGGFEGLHAISPWAAGEVTEHLGWMGQTGFYMIPSILVVGIGSLAPASSDPAQARARRRNRAIYRGAAIVLGTAAVVAGGADIAAAATHAGHIVGTLDRDTTGFATISATAAGLAAVQRRGMQRDAGLSE